MKKVISLFKSSVQTGGCLLFVEESAQELSLQLSFFNKDNEFVTDKKSVCDKSENITENADFFRLLGGLTESDDIDGEVEIFLLGLRVYAQTYFCATIDDEYF